MKTDEKIKLKTNEQHTIDKNMKKQIETNETTNEKYIEKQIPAPRLFLLGGAAASSAFLCGGCSVMAAAFSCRPRSTLPSSALRWCLRTDGWVGGVRTIY